MFGRRRRAHAEYGRGIRNRVFKEQLRLGSKRKALVLEIVKRAFGLSAGCGK
jgi:hypothetical protein